MNINSMTLLLKSSKVNRMPPVTFNRGKIIPMLRSKVYAYSL